MTLSMILKAGALLVLSVLPTLLSAAETDAELKTRMVGTWLSMFEWKNADDPEFWVTLRGRDTYGVDGQVRGMSISRRGSMEERVEYFGRWDIKDGVLVVEVTKASGGYSQAGTITRDRIIRMDVSTLTLEAVDGNTVVLQREVHNSK